MTVDRMIELMEIEEKCVLRNASGECDRYCAGCDLLQDDTELHEMYTEAIALLKAQEPVKPVFDEGDGKTIGQFLCGKCHAKIGFGHPHFCWYCGRAVKWE